MIASFLMRASDCRGGIVPSSVLAAMSLSDAALAREKPQARSASSGVSTSRAGSGQPSPP